MEWNAPALLAQRNVEPIRRPDRNEMVQPSKSWVRHGSTGSRRGSSAGRCLLRKAKVRAVFLVVADVFREQPFQMAFIQRDDIIQQVAAASHPALGDPIQTAFSLGTVRPDKNSIRYLS
jgi:hypothetical protein